MGITFDDMLCWDEDLMDSICSECKITASVIKARFKHQIRAYQFKSNKLNDKSAEFGKTYRIILSEIESKAMDALKKKLTEIEELITENTKKFDKLSKDTKSIDSKINFVFDEI